MKVLFATAEFSPHSVVGGLASASAGLVGELRRQGVVVTPIVPDYFSSSLVDESIVELDVPAWAGPARARRGYLNGVGDVVLVEGPGIARPHPYLGAHGEGWADNDRRFFAFSVAVAEYWKMSSFDVLHLNDWHTATALAHLPVVPPTVFTIHTLGYQGATDIGWLDALPFHAAAFEQWGACNPLAGAIRLAHKVVAVSPTYAREITDSRHGLGLDGLLRERGTDLVGILNGIDVEAWNPRIDASIARVYDHRDLGGKEECRRALVSELQMDEVAGPIIGMVTRLTGQKGVDLALQCIPFLAGMDARLVVLGAGDVGLADALAWEASRNPGRVAFRAGYDEALAHRITAGADLFLMPSRFEPCGLAQMQAMRYGTLPIVTGVGGLCDTVVDLDKFPDTGNGYMAPHPEPLDVLDAVHRAVRGWNDKSVLRSARKRGMRADWSWGRPAERYMGEYDASLSSAGR